MSSHMIDGVRVVIPKETSVDKRHLLKFLEEDMYLSECQPDGVIVDERNYCIKLDPVRWSRSGGWSLAVSLVEMS